LDYQIKEDQMDEACNMHGRDKKECGIGFISLRIGSVVGFCEYSNALSSYVKGGKSLE
jgi:hypothetical protein